MKVINIQEAKTHLSRYVDAAAGGDEVVIGKHGKPLARLIPFRPVHGRRPLGGFEGRIVLADDFDEPDARLEALFRGDSAP
jgi:prevent-host-death family protein